MNVFAPFSTQLPAVAHGNCARAARVRAGFRFGERPAAEFFALRERHDVFLFLFFAAEFVEVIRAERIVRRDDQSDRAIHARQLFDGDDVFGVAEAGAAVRFGENDAEQPHLRRASE